MMLYEQDLSERNVKLHMNLFNLSREGGVGGGVLVLWGDKTA